MVEISVKIASQLQQKHTVVLANEHLRRSLSLQKDITLEFARDIEKLQAERDQLQADKLELQIKCSLQQEDAVKCLRRLLHQTREAIKAYNDRDRCLEAMLGMKEDMQRGTVIIETIKKENDDLRAQLAAYRAARKGDVE